MMRLTDRTVSLGLGFAMVAILVFSGLDASAGHYDNGTIDDVAFGPTQATGGSKFDNNYVKFNIGIEGNGGNFDSYPSSSGSVTGAYYGTGYGRYVYSFRSVNGSFFNSNEAGTKGVWFEWLMTEPDTTKRSLTGASLNQKHDVILRVTLYTTGGTTTQGSEELDACAVKADAKSPKDTETVNSVKVTLTCKGDALADLGFSDDQIDAIQEALETKSRTMKYIWKQGAI